MIGFNFPTTMQLSFNQNTIKSVGGFFEKNTGIVLTVLLSVISVLSFLIFYANGLGLAYNDARSHLDIGRRVVEGLKPGLAQLGSVWLPLPHILMIPTVWNDFMWHSGLSGALISMASFVGIGIVIYKLLEKIGVSLLGRLVGVFVFVANLNVLYLQSTAMTELLLAFTMLASIYELIMWHKNDNILHLVKGGFWVMLASLVRYDGWFLLFFSTILIFIRVFKKWGWRVSEGVVVFFLTLAALGIVLWFLWNQLIFKDPFYFAFGPYSARAQQAQLEQAGVLVTRGNIFLSTKIYLYALIYNTGAFTAILGLLGLVALWFDKNIKSSIKIATSSLLTPLLFNILALYLGHSVLFIQGISGNTWFNVRYGVMMVPTIAIFVGYLVHRFVEFRTLVIGLFLFVTFFAFANVDAVTIDDARVGSSQKNVSLVAGWLENNGSGNQDLVLISAASHDAIIFSSGFPMKRFIHEGTGDYWKSATSSPDRWARYLVLRTHDLNDETFRLLKDNPGFGKYNLALKGDFADIYELKEDYRNQLPKEPLKPFRK